MSRVTVHAAPWVLPMVAAPIADGAVAVDGGGTVRAVGRARDLDGLGEVVRHDGVLMPGVINAHTHLELSHLEVAPGGGFADWARRMLAQRAAATADARAAARAAAAAMLARGTVAVADVSNEGWTAGLCAELGLEALVLHERLSMNGEPAPAPPPLAPELANGRVREVATAHATYSCGPAALRTLAAANGGHLAAIHVEEDPAEAEWLVTRRGPLADFLAERAPAPAWPVPGLRPIEWLDSLGVLGTGTLLVHLTVADAASLALAAARGARAVLCPRSNLHIGARLPSVRAVRAAGLEAALGTDSLASSPSLDVLAEAQTLARAGEEPAWLVTAATLGGARALGRPHLGALAPGLRPGLLAVGDAGERGDPLAWVAHEAADAPIRRLA